MLTPLMIGGRRTCELTVLMTASAGCAAACALAICSWPPVCVFVETHPIVDCTSAEPGAWPPTEISSPDASGTTRYHCGVLRSTTIRVTAGFCEYKLARTLITSPRLTA